MACSIKLRLTHRGSRLGWGKSPGRLSSLTLSNQCSTDKSIQEECHSLYSSRFKGLTVKIFVADDSAMLREQIIELLTELTQIEIIGQAQDAMEAFHSIRELKPDVVTLDIQMNGGSGIDVLEKIKREENAPVIIMLTN